MKLAINGGTPVRDREFPAHRTLGREELEIVREVLEKGVLSKFLGTWHEDFYGGEQVQALEREWAEYFGAKHAVSVNSCTSGLMCAVGATGVEPGEEIIVSPYTMSASATAPLVFNAVPVFSDIESDCFCLDPRSIEERIGPRTRAVIVVDIFGQPYDREAINGFAEKHGLFVIEDAAQAPGATYKGVYAGGLGHMGVFSLNYHKHIHSGEGGILLTDDDDLAERARLIRNHAEAVVEAKGVENITNLIGFNFRMTELEAAIARSQLQKLEGLLQRRRENIRYLEQGLSPVPALTIPEVREGCTHAYYVHALKFDANVAGVGRDAFISAVKAELKPHAMREKEGVKVSCGYVKPLYLQPMFQKKIAYGSKGFPFVNPWHGDVADYSRGICPVAEKMHFEELFIHEMMVPSMEKSDLDDVIRAFEKVWEHREEIKEF